MARGKSKGRKNKTLSYVLLGISVILIILSLFLVFRSISSKPLKIVEYDVSFMIEEGPVGFDVNGTALIFGRTSPGGPTITRFVNITNSYDFTIEVNVFLTDNIIKAIETNSTFYISSGESERVSFRLKVPSDFLPGNYTGKVRFEMYKAD